MSYLVDAETRKRALESFASNAKPIAHLLADDKVIDIMLNAPRREGEPGEVWLDVAGDGLKFSGVTLTAVEAENLARAIGASAGGEHRWDAAHPVLSCQAAYGQFRFEALLPPASIAPTFTARKYVVRELTLEDYLNSDDLTPGQYTALHQAAVYGTTILLAGETGSGKTTLLNAVIREAAEDRSRRLIIIEDTPELDCPDGPSTRISVDPESAFGYREAIISSLRQRPNAIVLGELRRADDAMQAVEAWNTGHRGMGTLHAPHATGAMWRVYSLCQQSAYGGHVTQRTIANAIQVVCHVKRENGRRVYTVCRVHGWSAADEEFRLEEVK